MCDFCPSCLLYILTYEHSSTHLCVRRQVCYIWSKVHSLTLMSASNMTDQTLVTNGLSVKKPNPSLLDNKHPWTQLHTSSSSARVCMSSCIRVYTHVFDCKSSVNFSLSFVQQVSVQRRSRMKKIDLSFQKHTHKTRVSKDEFIRNILTAILNVKTIN